MKEKIAKGLRLITAVTLTCFIALGMLLVLIQIFAIITLNGALATSLVALKGVAIIAAVILGFLSMVLSYMSKAPKQKDS